MSYGSKAFALVLLCTSAGRAAAQDALPAQASPKALSLDDALAYAKAHQPSLRAAEARAQAALADAFCAARTVVSAHRRHTVQAVEGSTNNTTAEYLNGGPVDIPRVGATRSADFSTASWTPYASTLAAVGVRQELFDFGKIAAQSAIVDAAAESTKYRAQTEALNLQLTVKESFFAVLAARAVLAAARRLRINARRKSATSRRLAFTRGCAARSISRAPKQT